MWLWLWKYSANHRCSGIILYVDCDGGHTNIHVLKLHRTKYIHKHTHTFACKTDENWVRWMDCINLIFLVVMFYYTNARCYSGGHWVRDIWNLSCNCISYKSMWIYSKTKTETRKLVLDYTFNFIDLKLDFLFFKHGSQTLPASK